MTTTVKRSAGILLHITSLPSGFGIGDLGPEARSFADFLHNSRQRYWQILPINPTEAGQGHSPYSSISTHAGNTLLISPELLVQEGLIPHHELERYHLPQTNKTDFTATEKVKKEIFEIAWSTFNSALHHHLTAGFLDFCSREAYWLDDFALYMLLKQQHDNGPWYQWADKFKFRDEAALYKLALDNAGAIKKTKFFQFIFARQWNDLRQYCHERHILFFGDLPFYVSYDSVDVWSHRSLFSLDWDGNMVGVAGVPPDAFSSEGQLWGMPVFNWNVLKSTNFKWWIQRIKKNMELFDLIRLDHFRAFAAYWEVPAHEKTARHGTWKTGPGDSLFFALSEALGELPFIAEDLGDIDAVVYTLRDQFHFPGMKVLQFAFGHEMPASPHIPHNYSDHFAAYTGTHDNNTITGWFRCEGQHYHHQLQEYFGQPVTNLNIAGLMARLAYESVANIVILPLQDVLGLDEHARMNTPASCQNNWNWRLLPNQLNAEPTLPLGEWTYLYNRQ